jgi:hypothetical protein
MRAVAAILIACLGLTACAEGGPTGGVANYDALRSATTTCTAKGGKLVLQKNGDPEYIGDYACERK